MIGDEENIGFDLNNKEDGFRYYRIMVKIMNQDKVHHQNIEIYTTGLKRLLELRRLHALLFASPAMEKLQGIFQSN
jgi:hypothetical protein